MSVADEFTVAEICDAITRALEDNYLLMAAGLMNLLAIKDPESARFIVDSFGRWN